PEARYRAARPCLGRSESRNRLRGALPCPKPSCRLPFGVSARLRSGWTAMMRRRTWSGASTWPSSSTSHSRPTRRARARTAPASDAWMETERSRLREAARRLVVARAEEQLAVNRYVEARALARRALALDPYSDAALSLAMRSAALDGDPASGVALYQEFAERLHRDLGGRPSPQLTALAARIRENRWQRPRGRHPDREPPLIGRRDAHARLFAELERVPRDGSACLVIAGEPGSGRTRLLDACAERLALAGATVATARILESDHDAPWSTLRGLMRGGLLDAPGIPATDHLGLR